MVDDTTMCLSMITLEYVGLISYAMVPTSWTWFINSLWKSSPSTLSVVRCYKQIMLLSLFNRHSWILCGAGNSASNYLPLYFSTKLCGQAETSLSSRHYTNATRRDACSHVGCCLDGDSPHSLYALIYT